MKQVFDFVQGKLSYDEFEAEFTLHPEIWTWVQQLIPQDITDAGCPFRAIYHNMQGLETNQFNVYSTIMAFGYSSIYGRNVAYDLIRALVQYNYPEMKCQRPPEQSSEDILDQLNLDYIGGPEVDEIVKEIIWTHQQNGKAAVKKELKAAFYLSGRKHPVWVQEPEWPAINGIPMKFLSQQSDGDKFTFKFQSLDANVIRIITQYA